MLPSYMKVLHASESITRTRETCLQDLLEFSNNSPYNTMCIVSTYPHLHYIMLLTLLFNDFK